MSYTPNTVGTILNVSARSLISGYQNGTGGTLTQGQPVSVNASGQMIAVDVTSDSSVAGILGVVYASTVSAANGQVLDCGRLENITTSFSIGDAIYIDTTGNLTNIRPNIGTNSFVEGDYIVFVGVVVKNQFNPSNKDLKVYMDVIGQL